METPAGSPEHKNLEIVRLIRAAEACMEAASNLQDEAARYYRDAQALRQTLNGRTATEVIAVQTGQASVT